MNPDREGEMSAMLTIQTRKVTAQVTKQATALVATYRENGLGSNRTNWARTIALLGAVTTAIATGDAVEVTEFFPENGSGKQYHLAHRALSSGVVRPNWAEVTVVVLRNAETNGKTVTGETTTTGKGRVFIAPTQ